MKKQLSLFLVLVLVLTMFGNVSLASAATVTPNPKPEESSWSFKTRTGLTIKIGDTIHMEKGEFQNFDIYKSGKEITPTDKTRTITWSSSNPDVIWIDASNGRARADKFGTMTEEYGEAEITAKIYNKVTKANAYRRFKVTVGTPKATVDHIELIFKDDIDSSQTLKVNETYTLETLVYDSELEVMSAEDASLFFAYFCDKEGISFSGSDITPTEEGEYTITVGAFETEEAAKEASSAQDAVFTAKLENLVVEDDKPKFISVRQIDLYSVALTFNKEEYAKELVANNNQLTISYEISGDPYTADFQSILIDEKDSATVLVTLYTTLNEGVPYTFTYNNGTEKISAFVTGSGTKPAKIELQPAKVQIEREYYFEVKILNDKGVDITNVASYACTFESLDPELEQMYILESNSIYFFNVGEKAAIRAKLDLGYDEYGNPLSPLTSSALFESIPQIQPVIGNCNGYALAGASAAADSLTYNASVKTICMGDFDTHYVYASFPYTDELLETHTRYIVEGQDRTDGTLYTYKSSDPSVVDVQEETGLLFPFAKGSASIYIFDANGKSKGAMGVKVTDERALTTFTLSNPSKSKLSATGNEVSGDEYITMKLNAKDQLGDKVNATYTIAVTSPADSDFNLLFKYEIENDTLKIWEGPLLSDTVTTKNPKRQFTIEVTASYGEKSIPQKCVLTVKNVMNVTATTASLDISNTKIDLKLDKDSFTEYESEIQVISTDKEGYFVSRESAKLIYSAEAADITEGQYSILILYKNAPAENITVEQVNGKLIFKPITTSGGNEISKAATGTYKICLYRGNGTKAQPLPYENIVLDDSTPSVSVSIKEKQITNTDFAAIKNALSFKRGTTDISSYVEIVGLTPRMVNNTYQISKLVLHIKAKEFNSDWPSEEDYTKVTLSKLNLQFKLPY